jgi:hypothetical protein
MKTNLLILTALFFFFSANAQETNNNSKPVPEARIGLKGGLSMATMLKPSGDNYSSNPLLGFNGGGLLILPLGRVVALQPEVLFSQKGYHADGSSLFGNYDYRRFLNFLDIPLLLRLNLSNSFAIVAGPQYSYLLSTHTDFRSGDASYKQTVNNENDNIRKNIFGGAIGADISLGENLFLYGRYTIDFKNNNGDGTSSTPAYKNQVVQVGLGIAF